MKFIFILLLFTLLISLIAGQKRVQEGYQSLTNCLNQGYPNSFCLKTPIRSVIGDGYCNCANRQLGMRKSDGKCHCFPFNPTFPYYPQKTFRDFPK